MMTPILWACLAANCLVFAASLQDMARKSRGKGSWKFDRECELFGGALLALAVVCAGLCISSYIEFIMPS